MKRSFQTLLLLLTMCGSVAVGQRATGVISGRVVSDDGRPIPHAIINIVGSGNRRVMSGRTAIATDDDGNFQADGLDPAPYLITATAPGYVMTINNRAVDLFEQGRSDYVYLGEAVTITMMKGGVLTGRVTSGSGEPVIGVQVRAVRVREANGRPVTGDSGAGALLAGARTTDDRGVYRLYGLVPGTYVISAGGAGFSVRATPYDARMPVYHPASTRDAASEITVRSGEEVSGIDIRYRAERGSAISGKVTGAPAGGASGVSLSATSINLRQAASGAVIASTFIVPIGDQNSYAFYGVANGEYELVATRDGVNDEPLASLPRRVVISGRDATGIDLVLAPLASLAGAVVLERPQPDGPKCESRREFQLDEVMLKVARDEPGDKNETTWGLSPPSGAPDEKGAYTIRGLRPGRYRLESLLPDEHWYLKAITQPGAAGAATSDLGRSGLALRGGEKLSGVTVTIGSGGAQLKGKVIAAEGAKLPARLRVLLVPAEKEAAENVLRYAEAKADGDGAFSLSHLAPGRYLLLARAIPDAESDDKPPRPLAWDSAERAKLRKEAEAANVIVELKACQRVPDFALRLQGRQ